MFINHGSHVELNRVLTWLNDPARELQEASQAVPDEHDDPDDLSDDGELSDDSDRSEEEIVATYHPKLRRSVTSRATEVLAFHQCDFLLSV
ncbi:hypothetical protein CAOG_06428 [Capsaspora owczarzaki ATCC 30864]|uniref:Uncharacterized protein n=1 Tax=Capsaspora owczarzaki (strain ATCC 30864) TaxID=595528 RepID=A0A0D2WU09_CAPO3|nr:hypothetical protein CAOG_06428 [Capsaspora owczarzaki ATCC 30864]KJE96055.1 hypothetical protein CAOG_006428 [Capsaspora owczarzaki ATCC 30864]|eukprot:XP_004345177.1 hypothetical protein CAOG_06428 [Capsaspora owczarzaki ATCC 30864]